MLNDYEFLKTFFKDKEIEFVECEMGVTKSIKFVQGFKKVGGHYGLSCSIIFDAEGELQEVSIHDEENCLTGSLN